MRSILAFFALVSVVIGADDFPVVPDDVEVTLFAKEPLVRNPCGMAFDAQGRLCVGMGPQYRKPKPDTPGDSVWILIDADQDGQAESRKEFATGFNAIQSLAWKDGALWVANAPDLTVVRDLDGDDEADEYVRLYTDLGNLEHGLHGLNWGPDGKLYMSKGNSKGLNQAPGRIAPKPFRDLWGMVGPVGVPDMPLPITFTKDNYQKNYHDPSDDWGLCGGVLRCDSDGNNLEIVTRGSRNPWDISFDDGFHWLGTDNDQNHGDKLFSPFYGAHFGWGHPWSYDWKNSDSHLPSAPAAGPLFEGSGTGVIYLGLDRYPDKYRGVFLVNDWLKRQVYIYRPTWKGAWMQPDRSAFELFADAERGRSMSQSDGRRFDPVDIEVGPDGAIYIASWGREYGAKVEDGDMQNEGRVYRFWPKAAPPTEWPNGRDPWVDLASHLPVWRANAQEILVNRGQEAVPRLKELASDTNTRKNLQTWAVWTLGRITPGDKQLDDWLASQLQSKQLNLRLQAIRILAFRAQLRNEAFLPIKLNAALKDENAQVRHETVLAIRQTGSDEYDDELIELAEVEQDRVVYDSVWGALMDLMSATDRKLLLTDKREGVRLAGFLSLLEEDALENQEITRMSKDPSEKIASLANQRLGGKAEGIIKGPSLIAEDDPVQESRPVSVVSAINAESGRSYEEATLQPGAKAYTDRSYRFLEIPEDLLGETFIRGANDDADADKSTSITLSLRYPSTVFLADDQRGKRLPAWARDRFQPTELRLKTSDAIMRVVRAELPAGEVTFGANLDDVNARKSQYVVIVRPKLVNAISRVATMNEVLANLATADAERGRTLFLSKHGATCATCHQMEGIGNVFAPDLSDIATRANAEYLAKAILDPSADITEGFAMQVVTKHNGESVGGIVLGETGRSLTIGTVSGDQVTVAKANVASRTTAEISAMPPLAGMLTSQQIADVVTYLLPSNDQAQAGWEVAKQQDRLDIRLDDQEVITYYFDHAKTKRPFFAHVRTPSGLQVTRNFPPIEGQDPTDHAFMHPGISLGFAVLSGENFWHNDRGLVVHQDFVHEPTVLGDTLRFAVRNRYVGTEEGKTVCMEEADYVLTKNEDGYLISMTSTFIADEKLTFGVKEEMGLAIRVASPLRVKGGQGSILNSKGGVNEKGTWGKLDSWWDYHGRINDRSVGLQVMAGGRDPKVWSHSRDYGVLVANPFPVDVKANRDKKVEIAPNEPFTLKFGVQIHEHDQRSDFDPAQSFARYWGIW